MGEECAEAGGLVSTCQSSDRRKDWASVVENVL